MTSFQMQITLNNPDAFDLRAKVDQGLNLAGIAWESEMRKYPPALPNAGYIGTHYRTNNLAKQVKHRIASPGRVLELLGPKVATYLLQGTGIYGPSGQMITPKSKPFLVWRVTDASHPLAGKLLFARAVRGTIWVGKMAAVKKAMVDAFKIGIRR